MLYDRKIKYLDYYEGGERIRGAGFVKLEARDGVMRLELTVKGLHPTDLFDRDVVLQTADSETTLGQIHIQGGSGVFRYEGALEEGFIIGTGMAYQALIGLWVLLGGTREIICPLGNGTVRTVGVGQAKAVAESQDSTWAAAGQNERQMENAEDTGKEDTKKGDTKKEDRAEEQRETLKEAVREPKTEAQADSRNEVLAETVYVTDSKSKENMSPELSGRKEIQAMSEEQQPRNLKEELQNTWKPSTYQQPKAGAERKTRSQAEENTNARKSLRADSQKKLNERGISPSAGRSEEPKNLHEQLREKPPVRLQEDKWQQLSQIYPHVQPFRDERDYLSVSPSDFVLFPSKYYKLLNNSFLLHGYYNYHHLILARMERRGEVLYYLGVPGNYFDREKQVAIMFGFESFECGSEPAKTGDFGYYMMRTEL